MKGYRFLHIANNIAAAPYYPMRTAFHTISSEYNEIDWTSVQSQSGNKYLDYVIREQVTQFKPEVIFMQIQHDGILSDSLIQWMGQKSFVISWTGDVRENNHWFERVGKHIGVSLFTNQTDVELLRKRGLQADYLQVGFDNVIYSPYSTGKDGRYTGIVFLGNNYLDTLHFPLSLARYNMCKEMWNHFSYNKAKPEFHVYGVGWHKSGVTFHSLTPDEEAACYRGCDIAINMSHFDYSRYSSDRLLRIMGCGAFCLCKRFPDIEMDFEDGKHLVIWDTIEELIEKSKFWMQKENLHKRRRIALEGMNYVRSNCTWEVRAKQLVQIIEKYK